MHEKELLNMLTKELPSIHSRLTSQDPTIAIAAHARLGDLCELMQLGDAAARHRLAMLRGGRRSYTPVGFVGMSVPRDD
jgi:hypothetical protein